jgi:hypothetical protein
MNRIELVAVGNDIGRARSVASALGGRLLCDERDAAHNLPFRALVSAVTDDVETLLSAGDVGAYVVCRRVMKPRADAESTGKLKGAIGLFTMVHHPDLTHREADDHWRDNHTPLAFQHHPVMTHYAQLGVVHRIHGPEWDGFALCGFDSVEDLRERFFGTPEGKIAIREDVAFFADTSKSPRRLIVTEASWEQRAPRTAHRDPSRRPGKITRHERKPS